MGVPVNVGDRVLVATDTTGTGAYELGAVVGGYLTPALAGVVSGSRVAYVVVDSLTNPSLFEIGEGTYTSAATPTVSRTLIIRNTTGGTSAINWSTGTRYLFFAPSASRFVMYDSDGGLVLNNAGVTGVASINSGPLAGFRNAVINGNFDVWQRGLSFSNPASASFIADRWRIQVEGSGVTRTLSRQAFTVGQTDVPNEPTYFLRFDQSVAGSGATLNILRNRIENVRTFAGQQITLSFYAKAAASLTMPGVNLNQGFGTGGSPSASVFTVFPGTASLAITTSWTKFSFTVTAPSISGKTIGTNEDSTLQLDFYLPINAVFAFDIAQVQLELGANATPFERRPLAVEEALCQRYFWKSFPRETAPAQNAGITGAYAFGVLAASASALYQGLSFPVPMRATPTMTGFNPSAANGQARNATNSADFSSTVVNPNGVHGFHVTATSGAWAVGSTSYLHVTASAE